MKRSTWSSAAGFFVLLIALPGGVGAAATPAASSIHAAYVLLAEAQGETHALARIIVDAGTPCPDLLGASDVRQPTRPRQNPNPQTFPVQVCEALYPFGSALKVAGGPTLPVVKKEASRVAVFGDSGCKPKNQCDCTMDDPEWPLPQLAAAAAKTPPDLVLHVGDYNYRGTPSSFEQKNSDGTKTKVFYYDAGDGDEPSSNCGLNDVYYSQNSSGNKDADRWENWWLDFFQPAASLLAAAPWVFARGNHELCSHAGPGYFYFLDASSALLPQGSELSCPPQDSSGPVLSHLQLVPPRVLRLGELELLLLDSANACDQLPGLAEFYRKQFADAAARLKTHHAWLISHRPVWGLEDAGTQTYGCNGKPVTQAKLPFGQLNTSLQCALEGATGEALLPRLAQIVVGHMHRFEALTFAAPTQRPPTLVVGNSGVFEDAGPPNGAFAQMLDGGSASGFSLAEYGYLEFEKGASGSWLGKVNALEPAAWSPYLPPCSADSPQSLCVQGLP